MITIRSFRYAALAVLIPALGSSLSAQTHQGFRDATEVYGPNFHLPQKPSTPGKLPPAKPATAAETLRHWNSMAIDASGLDHTPVQPGENRVFGEQLGPVRAARAIAIVHIAMFEAVNAIDNKCKSFLNIAPVKKDASMTCAVAQAAHDTLCAMFPSQTSDFDQELAEELANAPKGKQTKEGIALGQSCAAACLAARANDGSNFVEPKIGIDYIPGNEPGIWRQDPISLNPLALGAYWGQVKPFVILSQTQFRCPPPPALNSAEYTAAYNEAKSLGGDGIITPTTRTAEQTEIGIFWAYDGTPSLCAPVRLYNQITMHIADQMGTSKDPVALSRLLALMNTALADASSSWESKFFYKFWRPVGAIRESDVGTGPTGLGDGNPDTVGDINFTPLGAPASNLNGPNFTPPFPTYPSGHATFGGALFEMLRKFYGTDDIAFSFISDEFNGVTRDNAGNVRPVISRSYKTLSQAEEENGQSRIYLGIHWKWDKDQGIIMGEKVADWVFDHAFQTQKEPKPTPTPKPPKPSPTPKLTSQQRQ